MPGLPLGSRFEREHRGIVDALFGFMIASIKYPLAFFQRSSPFG
jgi:hypothetical protein